MPRVLPKRHDVFTEHRFATRAEVTERRRPASPPGPGVAADLYARVIEPGDPAKSPYPALVRLINGSRQRLFLHLHDFRDPEVVKSLSAACARGVKLGVIMTGKVPLTRETVEKAQKLEGAGADVFFRRPGQAQELPAVCDQSVLQPSQPAPVEDPAKAAALASQYTRALAPEVSVSAPRLLGPGRVELHPMPEDGRRVIVNALDAAKQTIDLEVYQLTDPGVTEALIRARNRGVRVRVM